MDSPAIPPPTPAASTSRVRVVVLGGGPCGLYAARRLVDHPGIEVTLLEKAAIPGGLATSHRRGENFYDLGTHMLHEFDREICDDVLALMGDESFPVELNAKIRWAGSFYRYPLQFSDMLKGIPPWTLFKCVAGLLIAQAQQKLFPRTPKNAEEALQQLYGDMLYRFFFKDFTHRYWGFPTTEMSATFITSKMPRLTAVDMIKKILAKFGIKDSVKAVDSALLEETLHYARTGAEAMPRHLARYITNHGGTIHLDCPLTAIERGPDGRVIAVRGRHAATGVEERIEADHIISTVPLQSLLAAIDTVPAEVRDAVTHLHSKALTIHGLLVNKPKCLDALYIYYRERLFHRIGEPKNAGLTVTPADHTVLIIETTCEIGDDKWHATTAVREQIIADLEAEAICSRDQIVEWHVLHAETGYPVFRLGFEPHHEKVKEFLKSIPNLQTTGRQGGFCYPNMHAAMRMGAKAADAIAKATASPQRPVE